MRSTKKLVLIIGNADQNKCLFVREPAAAAVVPIFRVPIIAHTNTYKEKKLNNDTKMCSVVCSLRLLYFLSFSFALQMPMENY